LIVISGQVASGKTTAGKMLRDRGFQYARISQAIKKRWDPAFGEKPPRSWYQEMGMKLHREIGQRALCQETMSLIRDASSSFVIDGARWHEDIAFFRDEFGSRVIHIHLIASTDVRKRRFEARDKNVEFEQADSDEVESEVSALSQGADAVYDNSVDDPARLNTFLSSVLRRG
jgi:dephospho-CoA kinase